MRVACVGGGPAGLFLAIMLRRADSRHAVDVYDRNPAGASYGFGVVFSRMSMARLTSLAPDVIADVLADGVRWDGVEVRIGGTSARSSGHGFAAVSRQSMLRVLAEHAVSAGARICWEHPVDAWTLRDSYDLVVAADGAASGSRNARPDAFGARVSPGATRYAWFGTARPTEMMTFAFVRGPHGVLAAHIYPHAADASTVLIETTGQTWRAAGFADGTGRAGVTDERALEYCQEAFADELGGARLIGNGSRWLSLPEVTAARWSSDSVVLVGDAAHTTHFSIGSGTTLALEDAADLARYLVHGPTDLADALAAYADARQPVVAAKQHTAWASRQLWEHPGDLASSAAGAALLRLLTRAGQVTTDVLLRSDPRLAESVGRPLSAYPPPQALVRASFDGLNGARSWNGEAGPSAAIIHPGDLGGHGGGPDGPDLAAVAVVADAGNGADDAARCVRVLRERAAGIAVGGYVAVGEGADGVVGRAVESLAKLRRLVPLDFAAVGRGAGSPDGVRVTQMVTCQALRSSLGLPTVYACPAAEIRHGWTHVQAGRADQLWITSATEDSEAAEGRPLCWICQIFSDRGRRRWLTSWRAR